MDQQLSKSRLIDLIRDSHHRFKEAIDGLSEAQMNAPGAEAQWSVKDIAAHLLFWQQRAVFLLECARSGWQPAMDRWSGSSVDDRNAENYRTHHDRPLNDVLADLAASEEAVLSLLEATPDDELSGSGRFEWLKGQTLAEQVSNETHEHYPEHIDAIRDWRATLA